jgi:hypothetical protein
MSYYNNTVIVMLNRSAQRKFLDINPLTDKWDIWSVNVILNLQLYKELIQLNVKKLYSPIKNGKRFGRSFFKEDIIVANRSWSVSPSNRRGSHCEIPTPTFKIAIIKKMRKALAREWRKGNPVYCLWKCRLVKSGGS